MLMSIVSVMLSFVVGGGTASGPMALSEPTAGDGRHEVCEAAGEAWKQRCIEACPDDAEYSKQEQCREECGKAGTKVYWSCSACWTGCDKQIAECEAACPEDSVQEPNVKEECVAKCREGQDACHDGCKSAGP